MEKTDNWLTQRLSGATFTALLLGVVLWLGFSIGLRPLTLPDEGRYVGVAWEMLRAHNLSVPLLDGLPYFHKPPLFYWLTAFSLKLFGLHEWSARLASVSAAALVVLALWLFVRRHRGASVATATAIVLTTQPFFFAGAQFANLDMLVASLIGLTILAAAEAVLRAEQGQPYRTMLAAAYAMAALGVLAKGLIGMVLPGAVLLGWLLARGRFASVRHLLWLPALLLFLALGLPWFWSMQQKFSGFFDYFIVYHHFKRFAESGFNNPKPLWFYVPVVLLLCAPWSPWCWRALKRSYWTDPVQGDLRRLMGVWLLVILVFFSLPSSKLVGYIFPLLPPFAFLIAEPFTEWMQQGDGKTARRSFVVSTVIAMIVCIGAVVAVSRHEGGSAKPLAGRMAAAFQPADEVVMLDKFQFDLAFYLPMHRPAVVVSNWTDPELPRHDNWRKELFDAGRFAPLAQQQVLLTPAQWRASLCRPRPHAVWVWGSPAAAAAFPFLAGQPAFARDGDITVWSLPAGFVPPALACQG